ncbi:hypothetical protein [Treponema phagedenis]|nr:hypothetical protein [Treponema phagedenis]
MAGEYGEAAADLSAAVVGEGEEVLAFGGLWKCQYQFSIFIP